MGLIFSLGVIWLTYQVFDNIHIEVSPKKRKDKLLVRENRDANAA